MSILMIFCNILDYLKLKSKKMKVRVRFAPSPTGSLHIGGVRTALYDYAWAKKNNGEFIVRIEDTDQKRYVEGSIEEMLDMLKKFSIEPDESVLHGGNYGPYIQSERLDLYQKYALELVEKGAAYYCFMTSEELADLRKSAEDSGEHFSCRSPYRDMKLEDARKKVDAGEKYVIRQKMPSNRTIKYEDIVQGQMQFNTDDIDDTVLLKSDGYPTYHLAVVVDDHLMEVTDAFRAVEWLTSTPKHILLYEAFGWEIPRIAHLSAILNSNGKGKLSKRDGSVSAKDFIAQGYLPEAVLNFLMLLGWSSPEERKHGESEREIFSLEEFVELFDVKDLNKSNPIFNRDKLIWFNQKYIQQLTPDQLVNRYSNWLKNYGEDEELKNLIVEKGSDYLESVLQLCRDRVKLLSEISDTIRPFYFLPQDIDFKANKQIDKLSDSQINTIIDEFKLSLAKQGSIKKWGHEEWEKLVRSIADKLEIKAGQAFMVLRIKVLGTPFSPPLFESMEVLEKDEVIARLEQK